jgi:hypothetical protein
MAKKAKVLSTNFDHQHINYAMIYRKLNKYRSIFIDSSTK